MISCVCAPYSQTSEIPKTLKKLRDDPYRTLARYLRTSRGFIKCGGKKTRHLPMYVPSNVTLQSFSCFVACLLSALRWNPGCAVKYIHR